MRMGYCNFTDGKQRRKILIPALPRLPRSCTFYLKSTLKETVEALTLPVESTSYNGGIGGGGQAKGRLLGSASRVMTT